MHPSPSTLSRRTRAPSSSGNAPASSSLRSVLSLQDSFNDILSSPDDSFGSSGRGGGGHGKGQSLAHELVSALEENEGGAGGREGGGAGGMSLAEEFGIFEDVEGLDDPSFPQASTSSLHFQQDDDDDNPLFARLSSPSPHHLDEDPHFASHDFHFDDGPHALEIDDHGRFEEDLDGMGDEEEGGDRGQDHTPTRERRRSHRRGASSAARSRASSGSLRSESHQSRSAQSSPSTSPLRGSFRQPSDQSGFPPSDDNDDVLPRQPFRSHPRQQPPITSDSPRQRLFSSSTSPCHLTSTPPHQYHEPEQQPDLRPSTLIPLLSLSGDRSFEVEHRVTTLLTQIDEQSRKREAMGRELGMLEMEVKRFVGDGGGFESEDEEDLNGAEDASETEEEEEQDGMGGERSFDRSYTSSSGLPVTPTSNHYRPSLPGSPHLSSPYASNHSFSPSRHLNRSFDPDSSLSLQHRHRSSSSKQRSPSAFLSPSLTSLTSLTTSLLASLSSLKDTSQIELAGSADLGRRLRALRATFGGLKAEEEGLDRARREIGRFEDGWALPDEAADGDANSVGEEGKLGAEEEGQAEALGGGEVRPLRKDLKGLVEMEMEGFRLALGEFEEKTRAIRDEHQAWLANSASTATAAG